MLPKDKTWESGFTLQFVKQMSLLEFATILIFYKSLSTVVLQTPQDNDNKSYSGTWNFPAVTAYVLKAVTTLENREDSFNAP